MSSKPQQKPGVRTKLNSGSNKVKKFDDKNAGTTQATPNPTAQSAAKNLPSMHLTTSTNWAEETSNSVLGMATPVSSERTLGENKQVKLPEITTPIVPLQIDEEEVKKSKKKQEKQKDQTPKPVVTKAEKDAKNKYKKNKEKRPGLIDDIKASITQGVDSLKIDYDQLAQIQAELQGSADGMKSTLKDRVGRIKDYANNAMANMPKPELPKTQPKKKEPDIEIPKELPKPPKKEKPKPLSQTEVKVQEPSQQAAPKPYSETSIDEVRKAWEAAAASQQQVEEKSKDQELSQAIMRRDGAQKTLASLKAQLKYAGGEQKAALEERIKKKEAQLGEALKIIEELQNS